MFCALSWLITKITNTDTKIDLHKSLSYHLNPENRGGTFNRNLGSLLPGCTVRCARRIKYNEDGCCVCAVQVLITCDIKVKYWKAHWRISRICSIQFHAKNTETAVIECLWNYITKLFPHYNSNQRIYTILFKLIYHNTPASYMSIKQLFYTIVRSLMTDQWGGRNM